MKPQRCSDADRSDSFDWSADTTLSPTRISSRRHVRPQYSERLQSRVKSSWWSRTTCSGCSLAESFIAASQLLCRIVPAGGTWMMTPFLTRAKSDRSALRSTIAAAFRSRTTFLRQNGALLAATLRQIVKGQEDTLAGDSGEITRDLLQQSSKRCSLRI